MANPEPAKQRVRDWQRKNQNDIKKINFAGASQAGKVGAIARAI
jgi:hypothetical protein